MAFVKGCPYVRGGLYEGFHCITNLPPARACRTIMKLSIINFTFLVTPDTSGSMSSSLPTPPSIETHTHTTKGEHQTHRKPCTRAVACWFTLTSNASLQVVNLLLDSLQTQGGEGKRHAQKQGQTLLLFENPFSAHLEHCRQKEKQQILLQVTLSSK